MKKDLTGRRFGRLTVVGEAEKTKNGKRYWLCRCDCGRECWVEGYHLKSGHTKSCGCYRRELPRKRAMSLTGMRFGKLTVLGPENEDGSSGYWRCRCDCGNEIVCRGENLRSGNTKSCGCLRETVRRENMKKAIHFVEGTCVERIAKSGTCSGNTGGCRGVYQRENGRWRAAIGFQGKVYNLGTFQCFEDAVKARMDAEERMYAPFLDRYFRKKEEGDSGC